MLRRILLVDDHQILRQGLSALLENEDSLEVVGEAEDGLSAVQLTERLSPDLVIMDVGLPLVSGVEATRQIISSGVGVKVLILSDSSDQRIINSVLRAGASGYLLKNCDFSELKRAIEAVASGERYLCSRVSRLVVEAYLSTPGDPQVTARLTARERQVLQLLSDGQSTKEIAHLLRVSVKTISTYRTRLMDKLHCRSVADLTKVAIREGLTPLDP